MTCFELIIETNSSSEWWFLKISSKNRTKIARKMYFSCFGSVLSTISSAIRQNENEIIKSCAVPKTQKFRDFYLCILKVRNILKNFYRC